MPSATTKKGGECMGTPDVCKVPGSPPVPTPFVNIAGPSGAKPAIKTVLIQKKETVVETSKIPSSKGNEPGSVGGIVSGSNRDTTVFKSYSPKVYAKNKKMVHHKSRTAANGSNANLPVANHTSPSQSKVDVAD